MISEFERQFARAVENHHAREECLIRKMLGKWVSELEPSVARGCEGELLGLTIADLPIGSDMLLVVKA